ncbi:hypothetical protein C8Q73DRAFT_621596, partial [Cubamyces lactineus]
DHEEYCCVMLVLFSPHGWRSGADLRGDAVSWSEAYDNCSFSAEHKRIMCNMNVLYECRDARDDYSSLRR